jgi:hypothetical protein
MVVRSDGFVWIGFAASLLPSFLVRFAAVPLVLRHQGMATQPELPGLVLAVIGKAKTWLNCAQREWNRTTP